MVTSPRAAGSPRAGVSVATREPVMPSLCGLNRALGHQSSWMGRSDQAFSCFLYAGRLGRCGWLSQIGVAGGLGTVLAAGRGSPVQGHGGGLLDLPARVLLEAMVVPALRTAITFTRSSTCLVWSVMLEITLGSWPSA